MEKKHWAKRFFCCHIMKDVKSEKLYSTDVSLKSIVVATYDYFATTVECVKCGHTRVEQRRNKVHEEIPN